MFAQVVRLQLSNVAVRNCRTSGVQDAPKLLVVINYVERVNPACSPDAKSGRHYRKACCWRGGTESSEEAKASR